MMKENTKLVPAGELRVGDIIHLTGEIVVSRYVEDYKLPKSKQKLIIKLRKENGVNRVTDWGVNTKIRIEC
jgi:tartrate dehydratase beta subunit/fumarate hydratase class I family protein